MRTFCGALIVLVACATPPPAKPTTATPQLEVKTYAPLRMKADAKSPNQAVILGTDKSGSSSVLPLPASAATMSVDALGDMSPVKLATAPNADGSVQVGIFAELPGGAAAAWRAGVWTAALVAATTLDKDLTDFTFSAAAGGNVDGASALIAAGFLAVMTGAPVAADVTLTGVVDPDGTIGPVAGLPEKLAAALDKRKKRVGYPAGMRMARSTKTSELVDLEAMANARGAQAIAVADVHQAYKLLTGKVLPASVPVDASEMALDDATNKALDAKYKQWQERLATEWGAILQLESAGRLPSILVNLRDSAKRYAEVAEALHKQGLYAAAHQRIVMAWTYASTANEVFDILSKATSGKLDDAAAALTSLDNLDEQTSTALAKIGALQPPTIGGHLQMLAAFRAALRGWAFRVFASGAIASTKTYLASLAGTPAARLGAEQSVDKLASMVAPTILYVKKSVAESTLATEQLELSAGSDIAYTVSVADVQRLAMAQSAVGAAGVAELDALLVQPRAQSAKISEDEARLRVEIDEPDYVVALMTSRLDAGDTLLKDLEAKWGAPSLAWGMLSLAAGELAHAHAADLRARYGSLEIKKSSTGEVTGVEHEKAFTQLLASAERRAREHSHAARVAIGTIPVQARIAYQLATVESKGTVAEKLDALAQFWSASASSQAAVMLARN